VWPLAATCRRSLPTATVLYTSGTGAPWRRYIGWRDSSCTQKGLTMKSRYQQLIAAGLLATFRLAASAQTPPPAPMGGDMPQHGMREHRMDPAKMQEHMAKRQAALKQKLQLTPAQEGAWNAWTAAMKPGEFKGPERGELEKLTTPERIDRMRAMRD